MKHFTDEEALIDRLLRRSRTVAIIGASPRPSRHSYTVVNYLRGVGYEVLSVRHDRQDVARLSSWARLEDIPGPVDLVVVFRRPDEAPLHIEEAARKGARAVWLAPGAESPEAEEAAQRLGLLLVTGRCIVLKHRHATRSAGHAQTLY